MTELTSPERIPTLYIISSVEPNNEEDLQKQKERAFTISNFLCSQGGIQVDCDFIDMPELSNPWPQWMEDRLSSSSFKCLIWTTSTKQYIDSDTSRLSLDWKTLLCDTPEYHTGYGIHLLYKKLQEENEATNGRVSPTTFLLCFEEDKIDTNDIPLIIGRQPLFTIRSASQPTLHEESLKYVYSCLIGAARPPRPARDVGRDLLDHDRLLPKKLEDRVLKKIISRLATGTADWKKFKIEEFGTKLWRSRYKWGLVATVLLYLFLCLGLGYIVKRYVSRSALESIDLLCRTKLATALEALFYCGTQALGLWGFLSIFIGCCYCKRLGCWGFGRESIRGGSLVQSMMQGKQAFYVWPHLMKVVFGGCFFWSAVSIAAMAYLKYVASKENVTLQVTCALNLGLSLYGHRTAKDLYDQDVLDAIQVIQLEFDCCGLNNYTDWKTTPFGKGEGSLFGLQMFNQDRFETLPDTCCTNSQYCSINSNYIRLGSCTARLEEQIAKDIETAQKSIGIMAGLITILGLLVFGYYMKLWRKWKDAHKPEELQPLIST